jgi:copper homeostasis protein
MKGSYVTTEVCVESVEDARAAGAGGADRLELCLELALGGLTPPADLVRKVKDAVDLPVVAMLRPRAGNFTYNSRELEEMAARAAQLREAGADAIVAGALRDGEVDHTALARLIAAAAPLPFVFHRAFDALADQEAGLDALIAAGCARVLTSGDPLGVEHGVARLHALVLRAAGRIEVMPGGGVRAANAARLVRATGATAIHFSGKPRYGVATRVEDVRAIVSAVRAA